MVRALWTLARPKGMALIALLPTLGYSFAFWDHGCRAYYTHGLPRLGFLACLWALPHAGTMWLNAALDRDEGEVLFGSAVAVPRRIEGPAYASLLAPTLLALGVHLGLGLCVLGCAVLAVLYSHPRTAWKGHAVLGPLANAVGYGVLSPLGGFLYAGLPPTFRGALCLALSVSFILAAYLAAQAFQQTEDRARGYATFVVLRGPRATLDLTRVLLLGSLLLTFSLAVLGWFPRAVLVSVPAFAVADRWLVRWRREPGGGDAGWARGFFVRLAVAGLLCLGGASLTYAVQELRGEPLAGLGTASGHPDEPACGPSTPIVGAPASKGAAP